MRSVRLILALGAMLAGLVAPASAASASKHKTYSHASSHSPHATTKHAPSHGTAKTSTHHAYKKPAHKTTYHHYAKPKPKPKPKPGIRSDGRYVLPGGLETTCAGGTPPPCR